MNKPIKIPLLPIQLFNSAAPTDQVYVFRGGKLVKQGRGLNAWVFPSTTIAVIPTARQKRAFEFEVYTKDGQGFRVAGEITLEIDPDVAARCYDFSVDPLTGHAKTDAIDQAGDNAVNILRPHFLKFAATRTIEDINSARHELEGEIEKVIATLPPATNGVKIVQVAVSKGEAADSKIAAALRARVAEQLLAQADKAVAERQQKAEDNRRTLMLQQAQTDLQVQKERTAALEARIANDTKEAVAKGEAIRNELAPFKEVDATVLLAYALQKDGIGPVTITPDFLSALRAESIGKKAEQ